VQGTYKLEEGAETAVAQNASEINEAPTAFGVENVDEKSDPEQQTTTQQDASDPECKEE